MSDTEFTKSLIDYTFQHICKSKLDRYYFTAHEDYKIVMNVTAVMNSQGVEDIGDKAILSYDVGVSVSVIDLYKRESGSSFRRCSEVESKKFTDDYADSVLVPKAEKIKAELEPEVDLVMDYVRQLLEGYNK